jgi:uncharacterized protein YdhG (YjbR/CyaY superfamily)
MKSDASTVAEYLDSLPAERRAAIKAVRDVIRKNVPKGYAEGIGSGCIAWSVPLAIYPDTYNGQPLMYAALASQKNHMGLYLMCTYMNAPLRKKLEAGFKAAGKKLDMGKACVRFKKLDDLPLDVIGEIVAAVPMKKFVEVAKTAHAGRK